MNTMSKIFAMLLLGSLLVLSGCNAIENLSNSGTRLILSSITGGGEGLEAKETDSTIIFCDVVNSSGGTTNTNAILHLLIAPLNPDYELNDMSDYSTVIVNRIDVNFTRTDGRNQPLVDVPLSFSVPVTQRIMFGETVTLPFVLVRHTAKQEPPLRDLREYFGQEQVLILTANITVYAEDLAGNRLEPAKGWAEVHCANFGDEN